MPKITLSGKPAASEKVDPQCPGRSPKDERYELETQSNEQRRVEKNSEYPAVQLPLETLVELDV